eukprot:359580-Rhodomonas_salina.5
MRTELVEDCPPQVVDECSQQNGIFSPSPPPPLRFPHARGALDCTESDTGVESSCGHSMRDVFRGTLNPEHPSYPICVATKLVPAQQWMSHSQEHWAGKHNNTWAGIHNTPFTIHTSPGTTHIQTKSKSKESERSIPALCRLRRS